MILMRLEIEFFNVPTFFIFEFSHFPFPCDFLSRKKYVSALNIVHMTSIRRKGKMEIKENCKNAKSDFILCKQILRLQ